MRFALIFLIALVTASSVYGQEPIIEDTLDWRLYYPLEVGNAWEWETQNTIGRYSLERRDIVADTLINEKRYFVQVTRSIQVNFETRYENTYTAFLRYDIPTSRLVAFIPETQEEQAYECDLSADFGENTFCGATEMSVEGSYADVGSSLLIGEDTLRFNAEKVFFNTGGWISYFHGVGQLPGIGDNVGPGRIEYVYLKLQGEEYGQSVIATSIEENPRPAQEEIDVFPNPAYSKLTIDRSGFLGDVDVTIFDLLGRAVLNGVSCPELPCSLNTEGLPSGVYVVHIAHRYGYTAVAKFAVVK